MRLFLIISFLTLLFSCEIKVKEIPEPKNLLSKEKMVVILEELMVVEQYVQAQYPQIHQFQEIARRSGDAILKKHGVSYKRFDEAMDYYGSRQQEMIAIYDQVLENINKKLNKL